MPPSEPAPPPLSSSSPPGDHEADAACAETAPGHALDSTEGHALDSTEILRAIAHAPARRPASLITPGSQWGEDGRYKIERKLGRGGMGSVYAAIDTLLDRTVALKVLDAAGHDARDRVLREAKLAARFEHERIARVYDAGMHAGLGFVAMEYVPGETLRHWMMGRAIAAPQVVDLAIQIAEGLAALHASGVVHRDLKPDNVMITAQGTVKLLDFGLARAALVSGGSSPAVELAGSAATAASGTPGYMAPEQWAGQAIDARVDVFALGVIIHELVTGARLFPGDSVTTIGLATLAGVTELAGDHWRAAPARLREHTVRMLARAPADRLASGREVVLALAELDNSPSLRSIHVPTVRRIARRDSSPRGVMRRALGTRARRAVAAAGALCLVGAGAALLRPPPVPPAPPGMARIDVGTIKIGKTPAELDHDCIEIGPDCKRDELASELPARRTEVPAFALDRREITNEQFVLVLNTLRAELFLVDDRDSHEPRFVYRRLPSGVDLRIMDLRAAPRGASGIEAADSSTYRVRPGAGGLPVVQISWDAAELYCAAAGKRLPTELEWEAAARGREDRRFPWGDTSPGCADVVLPDDGAAFARRPGCPTKVQVRPVGGAPGDVTREGVFDLGGNVHEWTSSLWMSEPGLAPRHDAARVVRGGAWDESIGARPTARYNVPPSVMATNLGFRCASDIGESFQ